MLESSKKLGLPEGAKSIKELKFVRADQKIVREQKYNLLLKKHSKVCMWCLTHHVVNGVLDHEKWCRNN